MAVPVPESGIDTKSDAGRENGPSHLDHADLPDIADLNADSDFTAFLREGVSEEIRRKALRVLWRSDPVLANIDGLNDYDEDFRSGGVLAKAVKTAYEAGQGYLDKEENRSGPDDDPTPDRDVPADGTATADPDVAARLSTDADESLDPSNDGPGAEYNPEKKSS